MEWNLEGRRICASYLGHYDVVGTVEESRVKYGGRVVHHLVDVTPAHLPMDRDTHPPRRDYLVDHEEVKFIYNDAH